MSTLPCNNSENLLYGWCSSDRCSVDNQRGGIGWDVWREVHGWCICDVYCWFVLMYCRSNTNTVKQYPPILKTIKKLVSCYLALLTVFAFETDYIGCLVSTSSHHGIVPVWFFVLTGFHPCWPLCAYCLYSALSRFVSPPVPKKPGTWSITPRIKICFDCSNLFFWQ